MHVVVGRAGHVRELGEGPEPAVPGAVQHRALSLAGGQLTVDVLGCVRIGVVELGLVQLWERPGTARREFHIKDFIG